MYVRKYTSFIDFKVNKAKMGMGELSEEFDFTIFFPGFHLIKFLM